MTLLITLIAAVIITIVWYTSPKARKLKVGLMCYMYWGASIMWLVDALFEYKEQGAGYFTPATADMINDSFLGICVIALGTVVWLGTMLISDPEGVVKKSPYRKKAVDTLYYINRRNNNATCSKRAG